MQSSNHESAEAPPGLLLRLVQTQTVAFALVGAFNTALGFVLFVAWISLLGDHLYYVAVALSYSISVVVAFVLHRTLVFKVRGHVVRDFVAFVFVNSGGLLLNMAGMFLTVGVLGWPPIPAQVVVLGTVAVVTFFGHRYVSFRRSPTPEFVAPTP